MSASALLEVGVGLYSHWRCIRHFVGVKIVYRVHMRDSWLERSLGLHGSQSFSIDKKRSQALTIVRLIDPGSVECS